MDDMTAVVLDAGSGSMKIGFAGDDTPTATFHSTVGRPKDPQVMIAIGSKGVFLGDEAVNKRGLLHLTYPIQSGVVTEWDDMDRLLMHGYLNGLRAAPEEHHLLLTEAPLNPKQNRTRLLESVFERLNVPYVFLAIPAFLALFASGRTTGLVVDSGAGVTQAVPIWEGYALPNAIVRLDSGGRRLDEYLLRLLNERGLTLGSSAEYELCRDLKERFGYVARSFEAELAFAARAPEEVARTCTLPDGRELRLENEHFRCAEALFRPAVIGVEGGGLHEIAFESVMRAPLDVRLSLYENIVLAGGSTLFPGLPERFRDELARLAPQTLADQLRVVAPERRHLLAWTGGSILASILSQHPQMWISRDEYAEHGYAIAQRKCY